MPFTKTRRGYDSKLPPAKFRLQEAVDRNTALREVWQHRDTDFTFPYEHLYPSTDIDSDVVIFPSEEQSDAPGMELVDDMLKEALDSLRSNRTTPARQISRVLSAKRFELDSLNEWWNNEGNVWLASDRDHPFLRDGETQMLLTGLHFRKGGQPSSYVAIGHDPIADDTSSVSRHPGF